MLLRKDPTRLLNNDPALQGVLKLCRQIKTFLDWLLLDDSDRGHVCQRLHQGSISVT